MPKICPLNEFVLNQFIVLVLTRAFTDRQQKCFGLRGPQNGYFWEKLRCVEEYNMP